MKLNFGCGGNLLPGWVNTDWDHVDPNMRVDISKPLPYADASADFVFAEHVVEHIPPADAWRFFKEVQRVLKPGGVFRVAVPSIERVFALSDRSYLEWLGKSGFGEPTKQSAVENQIVNHGHQTLWSVPLLGCCLRAIGFVQVIEDSVGHSQHGELRGIHGHGKVIGERNNMIETIVMEATKP